MKKDHTVALTYDVLAFIVGLALVDDFTANEQNAIGNWLFLVGQVLQTNAAIQQDVEEKLKGITVNINSKEAKKGNSPFTNYYIDINILKDLIKTVDIIKDKLESI